MRATKWFFVVLFCWVPTQFCAAWEGVYATHGSLERVEILHEVGFNQFAVRSFHHPSGSARVPQNQVQVLRFLPEPVLAIVLANYIPTLATQRDRVMVLAESDSYYLVQSVETMTQRSADIFPIEKNKIEVLRAIKGDSQVIEPILKYIGGRATPGDRVEVLGVSPHFVLVKSLVIHLSFGPVFAVIADEIDLTREKLEGKVEVISGACRNLLSPSDLLTATRYQQLVSH